MVLIQDKIRMRHFLKIQISHLIKDSVSINWSKSLHLVYNQICFRVTFEEDDPHKLLFIGQDHKMTKPKLEGIEFILIFHHPREFSFCWLPQREIILITGLGSGGLGAIARLPAKILCLKMLLNWFFSLPKIFSIFFVKRPKPGFNGPIFDPLKLLTSCEFFVLKNRYLAVIFGSGEDYNIFNSEEEDG